MVSALFTRPQHPPPSNDGFFCSHHCARRRRRDLQAIIHLIFVAPTNDCGGGDASPGLYVSGGYQRVNIFVYVIYVYQNLPRYYEFAHLGVKPRAMCKSSGGGGSQSALEQPKKERHSVRRRRGGGRRGYLREEVKSWKQCSSSPVFYDDGCQVCK